MPEIKNTFVKSKMNKDLDSRLIPKGEYRDGINISVSTSEGDSVGSLENIRGNTFLSNLGLTDKNLEIIGHYEDEVNNRIFLFITNYNDTSIDRETQALGDVSSPSTSRVRTGSKCYIGYYNTLDGNSDVLVSGAFLNFSKTHPICGVNIIEDLLFWTDNRNQPRKININKAIANPETYYTSEDHISVAKYAPWEAIGFLKETNGYKELSLINEKDEWLPPILSTVFEFRNTSSNFEMFNNFNGVTNPTYQSVSTDLSSSVVAGSTWTVNYRIKVSNASKPDSQSFFLKTAALGTGGTANQEWFTLTESWPYGGSVGPVLTYANRPKDWATGDVITFQIENPYYDPGFESNDRDSNFLRDKFMRFSYRFQYDDNEFSLMAPFSEIAFRPKQYGYFLYDDDDRASESSIVKFAENDITTVGINIPLEAGFTPNNLEDKLKVKKVQILSKESSSLAVKVIDELDTEDLQYGIPNSISISSGGSGYSAGVKTTTGGSGTGLEVTITVTAGAITGATISKSGEGYLQGDVVTVGGGTGGSIEITGLNNIILYNYKSTKPIKVLDENEITRVSDIVPLRAKTQEAVGNRIIYGNFLQNKSTPESLNYQVSVIDKPYPFNSNDKQTAKQFPNHTLKQNRTYQVGIVLVDRYGRSSNVILSEDEKSSIFSRYTDGGSDPRSWFGNSLRVTFLDGIPNQKTNEYQGIYNEGSNTLGWYSYRIVVQQKEQDYYNVYTPGVLSGNINFTKLDTPLTYSNTSEIAQVALFNDNINKVPRDLKEVGPSDTVYSSQSRVLYNRIKSPNYTTPAGTLVSIQNSNGELDEVITIRPFRELGDWTKFKGIDLRYFNEYGQGDASTGQFTGATPIYIYPGATGESDPFYLKNNKNPLIATIGVESRLGYTSVNQGATNYFFSKRLNVFETKPFISNLDIYYESSMSGTINVLNNKVSATLSNPVGLDITSWSWWLDESTSIGSYVTTEFEVSDASNTPITPGSANIKVVGDKIYETYQIDQATGQQTIARPNPFELFTVVPGTATSAPIYRIRTTKDFVYTKDSYNNDNWLIKLQVTDGNVTNFIEKQATLANVTPVIGTVTWQIQNDYNPSIPYQTPITSGNTVVIYRKDFNKWKEETPGVSFAKLAQVTALQNGSIRTSDNKLGLEPEFVRIIKKKGKWNSDTNTFLSYETIYDDTVGGVLGGTPKMQMGPEDPTLPNGPFEWFLSGSPTGPSTPTSFPRINWQGNDIRRSELGNFSGKFRGAYEWTISFIVKDASKTYDTKSSQVFTFKLVVRRKT
jgi:hypothetical protein